MLLLGGTGLMGRLIGIHLTQCGYAVHCVGIEPADTTIGLGYPCHYHEWDGGSELPDSILDNVSTVINLAGHPLAAKRWGVRQRSQILQSRVKATEVAVDAATRCQAELLIQTSTTDFYGDCKGAEVDETSAVGRGYWPRSVARWERSAAHLDPRIRLVTLRTGKVMSLLGGLLLKKLKSYSFNWGAPDTSADSYFGWIHGEDLGRIVKAIIEDDRWTGIVNATAPEPATKAAFHRELCRYYGSMLRFPAPLWLKRLTFGRIVEKNAFSSKPIPKKAHELGFKFNHSTIESALKDFLDLKNPDCMFIALTQWVPQPPRAVWNYFRDSRNWPDLNPKSHALAPKEYSPRYAAEGEEFEFDLTLHNIYTSTWTMKHINRKPFEYTECIMQKGVFEVWEQSQRFTEVAGGTRIDDIMRYRFPLGSLMQCLGYYAAIPTYNMIFAHRMQTVAKALGPSKEDGQGQKNIDPKKGQEVSQEKGQAS